MQSQETNGFRRVQTSARNLGNIFESDELDTGPRKYAKKRHVAGSKDHLNRMRAAELKPDFDRHVQTINNKFIAEFLSDPAEVEEFKSRMAWFVDKTAVERYMISPKGNLATLEGTPKGGLSAGTETYKTLGSYAIVVLAKMGKPVFGKTEQNEQARQKLSRWQRPATGFASMTKA